MFYNVHKELEIFLDPKITFIKIQLTFIPILSQLTVLVGLLALLYSSESFCMWDLVLKNRYIN